MTKRLVTILGVVLLLMGSFVFKASAKYSASAQAGAVQIIVRQSGKCLDVPDGSQANNVVVQQYHKCLDIPDGAQDDQVRLQQYRCHGGMNQQFRLVR